jgi:hypothetical protein
VVPHIAIWATLAVIILVLAIWRQMIDIHEDDSIHLGESEAGLVKDQISLARKVTTIDRAGKTLTVIAAVYGLAICGWVVYQQWVGSMKL